MNFTKKYNKSGCLQCICLSSLQYCTVLLTQNLCFLPLLDSWCMVSLCETLYEGLHHHLGLIIQGDKQFVVPWQQRAPQKPPPRIFCSKGRSWSLHLASPVVGRAYTVTMIHHSHIRHMRKTWPSLYGPTNRQRLQDFGATKYYKQACLARRRVDPPSSAVQKKTSVCTSRAQENCTGLGIAVLKYHQGRNTGGCMDGCVADHSAGSGTPL